jgi:rhodanese-related sulfurtransferase
MKWIISAQELAQKLNDENPPTIIDVRAPEAYQKGHLPGAMNIPRESIAGSMGDIPLDRSVVVYCNMHQPGDSSSENAAEMLRDAGYHARSLKGGFPEWKESGNPVERGETQPDKNIRYNRRSDF